MRKYLTIGTLLILAALTCSCADPSANKSKATVANAAPEASAPMSSGAETLAITPENSKVEFVASKVTRSHSGSFGRFSGTLDFVAKSWPDSKVTINIDTASVETDEAQLTDHLKTADFFDVAKFPKATFVSTKIEPGSAGGETQTLNVTGNFDLHGVKKSISFPAMVKVTPESASVNAEFSINRKDFAIVYAGKADDLIRDGVVIKLTLNVSRRK